MVYHLLLSCLIMKNYVLYLLRWQLSTPILAICLVSLHMFTVTVATIIANLIGGCIFFFVDREIFKRRDKV